MVDLVRLRGGLDATRLAGPNDLTDDSSVVWDPQLIALDPQGRSADQRMRVAIPEEDAGAIGFQQPGGRFGHLPQQRLEILRPVPLVGYFQDGLQAADATAVVAALADAQQGLVQHGCQVFDHRERYFRRGGVQQQDLAPCRARGQRRRDPLGIRDWGFPVEDLGQQVQRQGELLADLGGDAPASGRRDGQCRIVAAAGRGDHRQRVLQVGSRAVGSVCLPKQLDRQWNQGRLSPELVDGMIFGGFIFRIGW
ncbi:MAG: hypothetical protein A2V70_18510 [Planctomycetes bacterium RBG_13_63_9]|nr:MAG: hypothetical protein A2V70_18510 [Planctomycetes bacterium RBG_13_63_9]